MKNSDAVFYGIFLLANSIVIFYIFNQSLTPSDKAQILSVFLSSIALIISAIALKSSVSNHKQQIALSQRQILVPLWAEINQLKKPTEGTKKAEWQEVIDLSNKLELIAICWDSDIIDGSILKPTVGKVFIELWGMILDYEDTMDDGTIVRGRTLSEYNRNAQLKYNELTSEILNEANLSKLNK